MPALTGKQRKQLLDALVSAFPTTSSLSQMVSVELNQNLAAIAGGGSLIDAVFNLIQWAEARGQLDQLIDGALDANGANPDLANFVSQYRGGSSGATGAATAGAAATPPAPPRASQSLKEVKRQALEERHANLLSDYKAASAQLDQALDDVSRNRLKRQLEALERDITQVEADIAALG